MKQATIALSSDQILEGMPGIYYLLSTDFRFLRWNRNFENVTGYSPGEIRALNPLKLFHSEERARISEAMAQVVRTGYEEIEADIVTRTGRAIPYYLNGRIQEAGGKQYLIGFGIENTGRAASRRAMEESNRNQQAILDAMPFGMMVVDREKRVRQINQAALSMLGWDAPEAIVGTLCHEKVCPVDCDKCPILDLHQELIQKERFVRHRDGHQVPVIKTVIPVNLSGEELLLEGFVDISSLRNTELELRESKTRWKDLFNLSRSAIAIYTPGNDGQTFVFKELNPAAVRLERIDPAEVIGRPVHDVFPGVEEFGLLEVFRRVSQTGKGERHDISFYQDERISGWRENYVFKLGSGEVVAMYDDVTPLKKAEEELRHLLDELRQSNEELEQFAYVVSHDLQEPLRMVSSFTQLLEKRYKERLDEDGAEFIRFIVDGAIRMQRMISDLLDFSRISTRGGAFSRLDASALLGSALQNLDQRIRETGTIVEAQELPFIQADELQVVRLFQNLIENAIKYRGEAPPQDPDLFPGG